MAGVENRDDDDMAANGVLKSPEPDAGAAAIGGVAAAGVAELAGNGCELDGRWRVGWTLRAAAARFAVSRRSASRNGSFVSPRTRWSDKYAVFMDSMY